MTTPIVPVVLSGGAGTRLWPLSIPERPKQFLEFGGAHTMFQQALERVRGPGFAAPVVIGSHDHRFLLAEELRRVGIVPRAVVLEPAGRNTAPAAAVAAAMLEADGALMLIMPSDHVIRDEARFLAAVETARKAAASGAFVTFGIEPDRPHTGYGYIKRAGALPDAKGCFAVERFVEKPDAATAAGYLAEGCYAWNAGIFLLSPAHFLKELDRLAPDMASCCRRAVAQGKADLDFFRLDADAFMAAPSASIDTAVMEKAANVAVVPVDMGWSDAGTWSSLWETGAKDDAGNVLAGPVVAHEVKGSYLHSESVPVGVLGLDDVVVVVTEDAVLVAPKARAEEVRAIAGLAKDAAPHGGASHVTVQRPWGSYKTLKLGERFQVKQIVVKPGGTLSLQYHHKRAEHWIVVAGRARVTRGEETFVLEENQSTYIPLGTKHRLENAGDGPLHLIEVQSGDYLGEDDIVRLEDLYGRT